MVRTVGLSKRQRLLARRALGRRKDSWEVRKFAGVYYTVEKKFPKVKGHRPRAMKPYVDTNFDRLMKELVTTSSYRQEK